MKKILLFLFASLFAALIALIPLLYVTRHFLIKKIVEATMMEVTGFRTEIGELHHDFPLIFTMQNVTMYDPPQYQARVFAKSPYFYIDIDHKALFRKESFHIQEWRVVISELNLEKDKNGISNGSLLKAVKKLGGGGTSEETPDKPKKSMSFQLDYLDLEIQKIDYHDRTGVVPKYARNMSLKASLYEDVTDFGNLVDRIEEQILKEAGASKIVKLTPFYFERSLKKAAKTVVMPTKIVTEGAEFLGEGMKRTTTAIAPEAVTEKIKEMGEMTREQFSELVRLRPAFETNPRPSVSPVPQPSEAPAVTS